MDIKYKVDEFKKGNFNKQYRNKENHIFVEKDLEYAIRKAYSDMMPRTLKKKNKGNKTASINQEQKKKVLNELAVRVKEYIDDPTQNFDKWHKQTCEQFCDSFYQCALGDKYEGLHFGKGQKIVNMTFKYLYCFDDNNKDSFVFCHMPLDKYTLDWFFEKVCPEEKCHRIAWSNLDYGTVQTKGSYCWIQTKIKEYLEKQTEYPNNPLEAEFYIWEDFKKKSNK